MNPPDDYDQAWLEADRERIVLCDDCKQDYPVDGDDVCAGCRILRDIEETAETVRDLPILKPIEQRPVELNAVLWREWRRISEKMP
jgi:hypothetical protein